MSRISSERSRLLEVADLRGSQIVVHDHGVRLPLAHCRGDLLDLALAEQRGRAGTPDVLHDAGPDDLRAGSQGQAARFAQGTVVLLALIRQDGATEQYAFPRPARG
jgi:hypothetical protein